MWVFYMILTVGGLIKHMALQKMLRQTLYIRDRGKKEKDVQMEMKLWFIDVNIRDKSLLLLDKANC